MSSEQPPSASPPAVSVRGVGKCYQIYDKPRDRLKQAALGRFRSFYRPFWALRDITMDIAPGEACGIIGRNGSGKSTLLQVIAGTIAPTHGEVHVRGRVAALLELGSGFSPDFTGRENVFLQGAILGIPRREMERRFDAIAEFADIGAFIDQPVKHYSSGMYARLAFSVAVSVDPEVLIVDEILAVGDLNFQQRCVAMMRRLLDSGVTLLYVSHAPDSVKSLCQKGLFLVDGAPAFFGSAEEAIDRYLHHSRDAVNEQAQKAAQAKLPALAKPVEEKTDAAGALRYGTGHAQIERVHTLDEGGRVVEAFTFGETVRVEVALRAVVDLDALDVHFHVRDPVGVELMGTGTMDERVHLPPLAAGQGMTVRFAFRCVLRGGPYGVSVTLTRPPALAEEGGITLDHISGVAAFAVIPDIHRPVHYKFHQDVSVAVDLEPAPAPAPAPAPDPAAPPAGAAPEPAVVKAT